jgi:4a-hydroxytetrahydrobiopterin dehydratase
MKRSPLSEEAIAKALADLPGWSVEQDKLRKRFKFGTFPEAISFLVRIAFDAERLNHHPEIANVYSTVDIALTTHDAGNKVTALDIELASIIERIAWV